MRNIAVFLSIFFFLSSVIPVHAYDSETLRNEISHLQSSYEELHFYYFDDPEGCLGDIRTKQGCAYEAGRLGGMSQRISELKDTLIQLEYEEEQFKVQEEIKEIERELEQQKWLEYEERKQQQTYYIILLIAGAVLVVGTALILLYKKILKD